MKIDFSKLQYTDGIANVLLSSPENMAVGTGVAGVDEAGRGPLLGPVAISAVVLDPAQPIAGLADSKKLSEKKRLALYEQIISHALAYTVLFVSAKKIDDINILQATLLGMQQSVLRLPPMTAHAASTLPNMPLKNVLIDGNKTVPLPIPCEAVVGGDAIHAEISAASILAKVTRDAYMHWLHEQHPHFGIDKHKGYPTKLHKQMLETHGILAEHRRSFKPISLMV